MTPATLRVIGAAEAIETAVLRNPALEQEARHASRVWAAFSAALLADDENAELVFGQLASADARAA